MLTSFGIHRAELRSSLSTFEDIRRLIFFNKEIEIKDRVAIMLFKLKSVFFLEMTGTCQCTVGG